MTNFMNTPMVKLSGEQQERSDAELRDILVESGRVTYRIGLGIDRCPPFVDNDMAVNWRMGWRWEHEEEMKTSPERARKRCHKDCDHTFG